MKLKEDMSPLLLQVFRSVVWVYSVITFLPWYLLSGASERQACAKRVKARSVSGSPAGSYRAVNSQQKLVSLLHEGVDTLDKVFEYAVVHFPQRDCLGTRELLSEEDEIQPNGKVFKKVILGDYNWLSYEDTFHLSQRFGSGLAALGQKPLCNIAIFCETRAEWIIAAQACFMYNFPCEQLNHKQSIVCCIMLTRRKCQAKNSSTAVVLLDERLHHTEELRTVRFKHTHMHAAGNLIHNVSGFITVHMLTVNLN